MSPVRPTDRLQPGVEGSAALDAFSVACETLHAVLEARGGTDAQGRLAALEWSLGVAPETGSAFMLAAGEQLKTGDQMLAPDIEEDAWLKYVLTTACLNQSRFSRESVLRYLHASGDLLAQVVNSALDCRFTEGQCSLVKVIAHTKNRPQLEALSSALQELPDAPEFKYVAAATNRMKHRNFLPGSIRASLGEDRTVNVTHSTGEFAHNQDAFAPSDLEELRSRADVLRGLVTRALVELTGLVR